MTLGEELRNRSEVCARDRAAAQQERDQEDTKQRELRHQSEAADVLHRCRDALLTAADRGDSLVPICVLKEEDFRHGVSGLAEVVEFPDEALSEGSFSGTGLAVIQLLRSEGVRCAIRYTAIAGCRQDKFPNVILLAVL
ncbi:hypothetical protein HY632_00185 [Candidatus Uhrbacteria bacterium]|nr:hypothetical protein [Candidatus Uhrbacteria bacterium]